MHAYRIETERLLLRALTPGDVPDLVTLLNDYEVAKNLSRVPHPYTDEDAHGFLGRMTAEAGEKKDFVFAITGRADGAFFGCCGVHRDEAGLFELGYWLGQAHWRRGYATEAARALAAFAFGELKVERITAGWFEDNPASGHVLEKVGFEPAGMAPRPCLARGHAVTCRLVLLERDGFFAGT